MYDGPKIIAGLVIFIGVVAFPIWFTAAAGKPDERPQLVLPAAGGQCVEPTQTMRDAHMDLLNTWRDEVVRKGRRIYTATDGRQHTMSLSNTCLSCHDNKAEFCDRCHDYAGVTVNCWDCHVDSTGE